MDEVRTYVPVQVNCWILLAKTAEAGRRAAGKIVRRPV